MNLQHRSDDLDIVISLPVV